MSGKVVGMVFDHYPSASASELLLATKLADNASDEGTNIYPAVSTLAERTRQSERTVQRQLKHMVDMGWLELVREARGGGRGGDRGFPRVYRISPVWMAAHDSRTPEGQRPVWVRKDVPVDNKMGDKTSPSKNGKWVTNEAEMGDTAVSEMGDTAMSPYPSLTVREPKTPLPPKGGAPGFDAIWQIYPKRLSEARARVAWNKLNPDTALQEKMRAAVEAQIESPTHRWSEEGGRFIPRLHTWLNQQLWLDHVEPVMLGLEAEWWTSQDGVKAKGAALGLPFSLAALGNAYTDDEKSAHWRAYRTKVFAAAGEGKWNRPWVKV